MLQRNRSYNWGVDATSGGRTNADAMFVCISVRVSTSTVSQGK
jgi:hypothetical protein